MIVLVKTAGDIEKVKQERVDEMFKKGLTVQPYMLFLGPNLNNIISCFVVINHLEYKLPSAIEAFEFCFKAYQVLDAQYPYACTHLWYLAQWKIFNYKTKKDLQIP